MSNIDDLYEQITARARARAEGTGATYSTPILDDRRTKTGVPCDTDPDHDDAVVRFVRGSGPSRPLCPRCLTSERRSMTQMIRPIITPIET